ncbi:MAG: enoyl-CoA hydratase-related protein [Burkholderiaceae bacterium]
MAYGGGSNWRWRASFRLADRRCACRCPRSLGLLAYGGTQFLPALVGRERALDMMLSGRAVDAREALAMGLVGRIADGLPCSRRRWAWAGEFTAYSQPALDAIRRCVDVAGQQVGREGLDTEDREVRAIFRPRTRPKGFRLFSKSARPVFRHR